MRDRDDEQPRATGYAAEAAEAAIVLGGALFLRRLLITTLSALLLVLAIHLLEKFREILQPLFVGLFLGFLILPVHTWLTRRGVHPFLSAALILALIVLGLFGLGTLVYRNVDQVIARLPTYETRVEALVRDTLAYLRLDLPELAEGHFLRELPFLRVRSAEQMVTTLRAALGTFVDFFTWLAVTFVYLIFLVAEKVSFPRRLRLALGERQGENVLRVVENINQAIAQYIIVKTLVSGVAGALSMAVLAAFGVDFALMWGILIFVLNFIPYLGSLIAVALPILLSFVMLDEAWKPVVIAALLIGIQQASGTLLETRLAGQRLDVSPLLILLSLAFWGALWGIVGMILAVPLLVILRIILDNIPETRPIATLISNQ